MRINWAPLQTELALWRAQARVLPIWWRDDDCIDVTPALAHLTALARDLSLPVHLAVVPQPATAALAEYCRGNDAVVPVVHGWAHANNAPAGQKKAEFGHPRADAATESAEALRVMRELFGASLLPMFVPPWNRIAADLPETLAAQGYVAVSTYLPRAARLAAPGLVQINTHMDPISWKYNKALVAPEDQISALVCLLQNRRCGRTDNAEPLGFLTHHLVQNGEVWDFTRACLSTLLEGGAVAAELFHNARNLP